MTTIPSMVVSAPTLGSGNLKDVVRLPMGENINEWMAVNIIDVFNQIHMLYGTICDVCTKETCPVMSAGPLHEYYWKDGETLMKTSAPQYIDYVMTWVQDQLDDEGVFPSKVSQQFPRNFKQVCETIMKRLFRVYAHVYHAHSSRLHELKAVAHANTSLKQFVLFAQQFNLVSEREMQPLQGKIRDLLGKSNSTV